ncbi:MAG TPA: hypothetical protein PLX89_08765 [Verrucomicrobiota bacterium]|nr:hypothetical protein [Verrucomicrobiales bacterium]HRI13084.1 hypothetical protein [Verrucomicrobiota bacterium]
MLPSSRLPQDQMIKVVRQAVLLPATMAKDRRLLLMLGTEGLLLGCTNMLNGVRRLYEKLHVHSRHEAVNLSRAGKRQVG